MNYQMLTKYYKVFSLLYQVSCPGHCNATFFGLVWKKVKKLTMD